MDLQPAGMHQHELDLDLPDEAAADSKRVRLMRAMDTINDRFGKGMVHVEATGKSNPQRAWDMEQERRTPHYTTKWEDTPLVRA